MYEIKQTAPVVSHQRPMSVPYIIWVQKVIGDLLNLKRK